MPKEFVIKHGFISKGDSIVNGTISGETLNLSTITGPSNSLTQVLVRNDTTGVVEYRDASSLSGGSGTNTFVTGFTYNDNNTFTITDNLGTAFTASINVLSATTISATTFYGDGSNLTGVGGTFTGNTSGDCITDLFVTNLYGCSPITVHDSMVFDGCDIITATTETIVFGRNLTLSGAVNTNTYANVMLGGLDNVISAPGGNFVNSSGIFGGSGNDITGRATSVFIIGSDDSTANSSGVNNSLILGGSDHTLNSTVDNSLILGGTNITARDDDTVYVPNLNIGTAPLDNTLTQILSRDSSDGSVKYRDVASIISAATSQDTFVTGTTFGSNQATLTRNDGVDVLELSGGTNVTLSNPSGNQINIDVTIPSGMNTYVTGFTYNNANTFTIDDNLGSAFTATINQVSGLTVNGILSATTISATTFYGDGSNLTGVGGATIRNVSSADTFVTANETINCTSGTFTVGLPPAGTIRGTTYTLVNSGTGIITLDPDGTETINGSSTIDLKRQHISRTVQAIDSNWIVI